MQLLALPTLRWRRADSGYTTGVRVNLKGSERHYIHTGATGVRFGVDSMSFELRPSAFEVHI